MSLQQLFRDHRQLYGGAANPDYTYDTAIYHPFGQLTVVHMRENGHY